MNYFDILLAKKLEGGGGGDVTIEQLDVTENGTYSEPGKAYRPVIVNLPLDEKTITANGTYNASDDNLQGYNKVVVNVSGYKLKNMTPGAIASFNDGQALPLTKLLINIEPVQAGSGDPSPQNERPISGWAECNVTRTGKNIALLTYGSQVPSIITGEMVAASGWASQFITIEKNLNYCFSLNENPTDKEYYILYYDKDKNYLGYNIKPTYTGYSLNTSPYWQNTKYIKLRLGDTEQSSLKVQLEVGSTATTYEPYNGKIFIIVFTDSGSPLTVYGGMLDVITGVLTVIKKKIRILTFSGLSNVYLGSFYISDGYIQDADVTKPIICNRLKYEGDTTTNFRYGTCINANQTGFNLWIKNGSFSSVSEAQQWLQDNETYIIYSLKTPESYQLTPTQVNALLGVNNIFADTGDILEGQYFAAL